MPKYLRLPPPCDSKLCTMRHARDVAAGLFILLCVGAWLLGVWTKLVPVLASGS